MKHLLYTFLIAIIAAPITAQSLNSDFEIKTPKIELDVYSAAHGTQGMILSFEYHYKHASLKVVPITPRILLRKNGMEVYWSEQTILPLETNKWTHAVLFIPYRAINLLNGQQDDVGLEVFVDKLLDYKTTVSYRQPTRYIVDVDLRAGGAKRQLKHYDKGTNPKEWLPDLYHQFVTNGGSEPVYTSKLVSNSYTLKPEQIKFHILEGEKLTWLFYDRDGEKDQLLGSFDKINGTGDYRDDFFGQMFGNIKNLDFTYAQRAQARQAISIYSDATYLYKKKKGVAVTIEYDLARANEGEMATIKLNCYSKNGIRLDLPTIYAIEDTPEPNASIPLAVKGKLKYFIPFYAWDNNCSDIEFYFELEDGRQINAARHTLLRPVEFDELVIDSGMEVAENSIVQGARGVKISLNYELMNTYSDAPMVVNFSNKDGSLLPFDVYHISGNKSTNIKQQHKSTNPKIKDVYHYFIPYSSITKNEIKVTMDLVPDLAINVLKEQTPLLVRKAGPKDVSLELIAAGGRFRDNNYGQVLEMKLEVPTFFLDRCELKLDVKKNNKKSRAYVLDGYLDNSAEDFILRKDSGRLYVIFPHRNITKATSFNLSAFVAEKDGTSMSDTVTWEWTAPDELFNRTVEIALSSCKFNKKIAQDTSLDNNFPWEYIVEVGGEALIQETLTKKFAGKKIKDQFKQKLLVNREDNIIVKLVNKTNKQKVVIWKGDLGKWEQSDLRTILDDVYPVKKLRVTAKIESDKGNGKGSGVL